MPWFSSSKDDESSDDATCKWPPTFQSFEEYKTELEEAVVAHPPFGVWLRSYRNANHATLALSEPAMWELSVQQLKERYLHSATINNRTTNAKRAFIEMHLEENKATYEKDQSELEPISESYALAMDSYKQAISHGYRNILRPKEPQKTRALLERDTLLQKLNQLVEPPVID